MAIQGPLQNITAEDMDLLREIGSQSGATAANTLSKMMNDKVLIDIPRVHTLSLQEIPGMLGDREKLVAGITARLQGDIQGLFTLILTGDNVRTLCKLFDSNPVHDLLFLRSFEVFFQPFNGFAFGSEKFGGSHWLIEAHVEIPNDPTERRR